MSEAKIKITAVDAASTVLREVRGNFERLDAAAAKVGTVLGLVGVAGIAGLATLARNAINSVDALNDLADATGASIENLSALEDIAARTGTEFATVGSALVKFNQVLKDSKPGSGAELALEAIGLQSKSLRELDPAQALLEVSKALDGFADNGDKARIVQELFGKSTKDVAALLKDLAEKGQLNGTVTTEQAKAAEQFNKELFALQKNITDASRAIIGPLVEAINTSIARFREGEKAGKSYWQTIRDEQLRLIGLNDGPKEYAERLAEVNAELAKGDTRLLVRNALLREQAQLQDKLNAAGVGVAGGGRGVVNPKAPDTRPSLSGALDVENEKVRKVKGSIDEAARAQEERIKLGRQLAIEQAEAAEKEAEAINKSIELQDRKFADYIAGLEQEAVALEKSLEQQRAEVEAIGLTKEQLNALTLARIDQTIAQQQAIVATAEANGLAYEEIAAIERRIELLKQQRDLTAQGQVKQAQADTKDEQDKASKQYADTLRNDLKGAFAAAFRDSENPLQAFGDALQNVVMSRLATALAESLLSQAGSFFGGTGGGGDASSLAALFASFDGGGYTGPGARTGGLDGRGGFMAMLHPDETVIDHTRSQSAGAPVTVVQNFTVGDVATVSMVRQAVAGSEQRIAGAMRRSMVYGGALA